MLPRGWTLDTSLYREECCTPAIYIPRPARGDIYRREPGVVLLLLAGHVGRWWSPWVGARPGQAGRVAGSVLPLGDTRSHCCLRLRGAS